MCKGSDIIKVAAVAAAVYTGGASAGLWGAAEGVGAAAGTLGTANAVGAAGGDALGSLIAGNAANWGIDIAAGVGGAAAAGTALADGTQVAVAPAAASGAAEGTGASFLGALKTGAQLAPLASLAMAGMQPKMEAQGIPGVSPAPSSQAASTPAPNIFKKKIQGIDPTKTSGVGGVSDISLGKATVLGS